eukprot:Skav211392  [mRNA]  locus=scaffold1873:260119:277588:+ [translate_table: standard]
MVMAGIAKRMEVPKISSERSSWSKPGNPVTSQLRSAKVLNSAFCVGSPPDATTCSANSSELQLSGAEAFLQGPEGVRTTRSNSSVGSGVSPSGRSVTGLYVRQHVKQSFRKFMRRLDEDSTLGSSPVSLSPGFPTPGRSTLNKPQIAGAPAASNQLSQGGAVATASAAVAMRHGASGSGDPEVVPSRFDLLMKQL